MRSSLQPLSCRFDYFGFSFALISGEISTLKQASRELCSIVIYLLQTLESFRLVIVAFSTILQPILIACAQIFRPGHSVFAFKQVFTFI